MEDNFPRTGEGGDGSGGNASGINGERQMKLGSLACRSLPAPQPGS